MAKSVSCNGSSSTESSSEATDATNCDLEQERSLLSPQEACEKKPNPQGWRNKQALETSAKQASQPHQEAYLLPALSAGQETDFQNEARLSQSQGSATTTAHVPQMLRTESNRHRNLCFLRPHSRKERWPAGPKLRLTQAAELPEKHSLPVLQGRHASP